MDTRQFFAYHLLIYLSVSGSVGLLTWALYQAYQEVLQRAAINPERKMWIRSLLFRVLIPFAQPFAALFGLFAEKLERQEIASHRHSTYLSLRRKLRRNLIAAGSPEGVTPDEFLGIVIVTTAIGFVFGAICYALLNWRDLAELGTMILVLLTMLGVLFPILWLHGKLKYRKLAIIRALPYSLDLLTLGVESGLDFTAALARIIQKLGDQPLSYEFAELLRQIRMGRGRAESLRDLAERVDVQELTSVASSLIQADELGASIGPVLRIQSEQLRVRRSQRAEKLASEAPVKMLFPLVCFIFPTIFIMIGGTIFLQLYYKAGL